MNIRPNFLHQSIETAITFLYPAQCRVCEKLLSLDSAPFICYACWTDIEYIEPPWCEFCGIPNTEKICEVCATRPPRFGKLRTIAAYETSIQEAIHLFKFEKRISLCKPLSKLIVDYMPDDMNFDDYDYIVPVPIHKRRLRERGFNQSTLLAKSIEKTVRLRVLENVIIKQKNTAPQSSFDREARQTNIKGAFKIHNADIIRDKHILLFDDVYTTGATIREVVNVLWNADPLEIDVLTLTRTLNPY